jgi:hypothetical protein
MNTITKPATESNMRDIKAEIATLIADFSPPSSRVETVAGTLMIDEDEAREFNCTGTAVGAEAGGCGVVIELNWKYRETQDSEFADAKHKCFSIQVQDCDGDMSRWHIKRGDQYVAVGEERSVGEIYHMNHAIATAIMVLGYLVKAVDLNDFVKNDLPRIEDGTHPFCFDTRKRHTPQRAGGLNED